MKVRAFLWVGVATAALIGLSGAEAAELALKRVLLSTGGVGLYEYEAEVEGDATVELKAPLDQIDDILKSLVVFDDHGGIGGLDLPGPEPLSQTFRALPFTAEDLQSTPQLLIALRGAEIEVGGPHAIKGRIVAVAEETETKPEGGAFAARHRVTVMGEAGLEQFVLEQAESLRFADAQVREALTKALQATAAGAERNARVIQLRSRGDRKRKLRVAYLAAAPVWKTSYRLVLDAAPEAKKAALQGWATLENLSGQDWSGVDLTLVSGRPVSYRQSLYRAYMIDRPEAPVDIGSRLDPGMDRGAIAADEAPAAPAPVEGRSRAGMLAAPMFAKSKERPQSPRREAEAVEPATAQEGETQVSFHLPFPVSVANGRTLSLPIVDREEPVARVALYDPSVDARHPLSAAELTNAGDTALPPGIVTIYESGEGGATYVGDSRLSATPAGEKRMLSFALDQKTTIEQDDSDQTSLARARIAKGVLTLDDLIRRRTVFHVKADAPRKLIVFASKLAGGKMTEPAAKDVTEADGRYRVPFALHAGDGQTFAVTQERTQTRAVALANLDDANLSLYAKSGEIDADSRAALVKLARLRADQAEAARLVAETQGRIEAVTSDQSRLKDLLGAVAAGSDLAKRYLRKLDADETELESQHTTLAARESARDAAARAVEAFVAGL